MTSVAEGVEKQDQLDFLWHIGCSQSQGYLHSRPIGRDEFAQLLGHGNGKLILPADSEEAQLAALEEAASQPNADASEAPMQQASP
jgi:predicted signal transduction protein with EAL and GGDEF domain